MAALKREDWQGSECHQSLSTLDYTFDEKNLETFQRKNMS